MRTLGAVLFVATGLLHAPAHGQSVSPPAAIEVPANAHLNSRADGWLCDYGFQRTGKACAEIRVPRNAILGPFGDTWICLPGFYTYRGVCLPDEQRTAAPPPKINFVRKSDQLAAFLAGPGPKEPQGIRYMRFAPFIAAALALGIWIVAFREREARPRPAVNYTRTTIAVQRPRRAVTVNAWRSSADRTDALTGAAIPGNVETVQCRNCRAFYRKASLLTLRRQNAGACIACGRAAFQTVTPAFADAAPALPAPAEQIQQTG
ncbi:MAG: hypothetical protein AB7E79_03835 [Rhodospirillaceae bacterium]